MNRYIYDGPVMFFDSCVCGKWQSETMATSEKKAKSNLAYQYKRNNNLVPSAKITLPGKLQLAD